MITATHGKNGQDQKAKFGGVTSQPFEDTSLPAEFIKVGKDVNEAIGRTTFTDDRQHNAAVALYSWAMEFECQDALDTLLMWLNGRPAIGGYNRMQAISAHTGVIFAEAMGVKLSKDSQRSITEQQAYRHKQQVEDQGEHNG